MKPILRSIKREHKQKRKRLPKANYSLEETELLVECALKEKYILEDKKSDSMASKNKVDAWNRIADDYNSVTTGVVRTMASLREKYTKLKGWLRSSKKVGGTKCLKKKESLGEPLQELTSLLELSINRRNASVDDNDCESDEEIEEQTNTSVCESIPEVDEMIFPTYLDLVAVKHEDDTVGDTNDLSIHPSNQIDETAPENVNEKHAPIPIAITSSTSVDAMDTQLTNPVPVRRWLKGFSAAVRGKTRPLLKNNKRSRTREDSAQVAKKLKQADELHQLKMEKHQLEIEKIKIERDHLLETTKMEKERAAELYALKMRILQTELRNLSK